MSSPRCAVSDRYHREWASACSLMSAGGIVVATVEWTAPVVVAGLLLDTLLVAVCLSALRAMLGSPENTPHADLTLLVRRSASAVCALVAVAAAATAAPVLAALFTSALLATSPPVLDGVLRRRPRAGGNRTTDDQDRMHA